MSLSWVSKLSICLAFIFASSDAFSEWISAEGRYFLSRDITQRECDANALMEARRAAMSKAGLETLASTTRDMCVEAGAETNCEMHQQTMNYFDGGFIAGTRNLQRRKETTTSGEVCVASIEANVKKYSSRADPNFLLQAHVQKEQFLQDSRTRRCCGFCSVQLDAKWRCTEHQGTTPP